MLWCACVACLQKTGSLLLKTRRGQARPQVIYKVLYNTSNIFFFSFPLLFHIFLQSLINVDLLVHNRFPSMLLDVYLFLSFMFYFQGFLLYSSICLSGHCFIGLWPWKNQVQNMDLKKTGCKKKGHCYSKREEAAWLLLFLNNNDPVFLHPAFATHILDPAACVHQNG